MAVKTETIRARVEPKLKNEVEAIFEEVGLNQTSAINLFYRYVKLNKGLPFEIKIPNAETIKSMKNVERGAVSKSYNKLNELIKDLES
jgi:DNA-damage-inducible protein J